MKDISKMCATCKHEHPWGILRYSDDGVPIYGSRICEAPVCPERSHEFIPESANTLPAAQTKELWETTAFMNPQTPAASRIAFRQIAEIKNKAKRAEELTKYQIANVLDVRAALVGDDNKFAHLVAHTDEIVESMRGVTRLAERLGNIAQGQMETQEHIAKLEAVIGVIAAKLGIDISASPDSVADRIFNGSVKPDHTDDPIVAESRKLD